MIRKLPYIYVFLLCGLCDLSAHEAFFRTVSVEDGMSSNFVRKIYRDSRGFIWIGTINGLDRFDGLSFKPYFADKNVCDLLEISPDFLWIATDRGLWKLNYDDEQLHPFDLGTDCKVQCLAQGAGDRLLVGTNRGLFVIFDQKVQLRPLPDETEASSVGGICPDDGQTCWLATDVGLYRYDYSGVRPQSTRYPKEGDNSYRAIAKIGPSVYLGTHGDGIIKFDIRSRRFSEYIRVGNEQVLFMSGDGKDHLWVGTDGGGLKKISVSTDSIVASYTYRSTDPSSIGSNAVYSALDDNGTLWVGTYSSGLSYSVNKLFRIYTSNDFSTLNRHIRSFAIRGTEKLIGTRDGFIYIDETRNMVKSFKEGQAGCAHLLSNTITSIYPYGQKYLLGTLKGLSVFDAQKQTITRFDDHPIFTSSSFYGFTIDRNHRYLWMATFQGVFRYSFSEKSIKQYTESNSALNHSIVHSVKADSKDRIWIGTKGGVCYHCPVTDSIKNVSVLPASIDRCKITHIYEDRNNNIWFCTETDGLYSVNSNLTAFQHYTTAHHLPDKSVTSIMEDNLGFFWIATHKGLVRCAFVDNKCHTFWLSDGLPGLMFNPSACYYDRSANRLWWGNESGLVYCNAIDLNTDRPLPRVQLIRFYINGKEITAGEPPLNKAVDRCNRITLPHAQNSFGLDFVALDYIYPNNHTFEARLDGYDREWVDLDRGHTSVQYTNIRQGTYIFRVRLAGQPETERSVSITVKRSWSIMLGLIPIIVLLGAWYVWYWKRLRVLIRKQKIYDKRKSGKKELPTKDLSKVNREKHQALLRLMEDEKPYLNPDLKISYLATALECTPATLSQLFKSSVRQSFSDFVNGYRVEEFKQKVARQEHKKYTLLALSEQCGFGSRSSFFKIFKDMTGVTPIKYLKQMETIVP